MPLEMLLHWKRCFPGGCSSRSSSQFSVCPQIHCAWCLIHSLVAEVQLPRPETCTCPHQPQEEDQGTGCHYTGIQGSSSLSQSMLQAALWSRCQKETATFVKLPFISLGLGESRRSFKLSSLFPGFFQACVLILSDIFLRFSQFFLLPFTVDILASTAHAPNEWTYPYAIFSLPLLVGQTLRVTVKLNQD